MIELYGVNDTRAFRNRWMLEELGLEYKLVPVTEHGTRTPEFLAINPNGHVPVLVDGELKLVESMAINLYLAMRYGGGLWPESLEDRARAVQWSFWVMLEVEEPIETALNHRYFFPEAERDAALGDDAERRAQAPLGVLNSELAGKPFILGEAFTVADLNVAAVLLWARFGQIPLEPQTSLHGWFRRCVGRPARKRASKG